ncbi:hypothetical protein MAH_2344 [Mycobacterium avium subsp. hominissuis TH135]|nr:hypothetical protein MAH_2344 [Mycobacterium avium subsp. hominissuis TH135]
MGSGAPGRCRAADTELRRCAIGSPARMGPAVRVRRSALLSGHQDVGTAEFSRGNPAVSNHLETPAGPQTLGLELRWPTRRRGARRRRRAGTPPGPETDFGINLVR